jgi:16S rRNA (cytidine1402-2'-O)-methyltransferase
MATLYVVGTPIGNLKDITLRALETLKEVDFILCEDTRVTKKLLNHYEIATPTISYHQYSKLERVEEILDFLKAGKNIAMVSDAGTPGISDPGNELIAKIAEKLPEVLIVPIPGASAATALASIAGFPMDRFLFLGFPPVKKGRKKFFEQIAQSEYPVMFYESPYRVMKSLQELPEKQVLVGRELTKKFETISRGSVNEVIEKLQKSSLKGEFAIVVGKTSG